MDYTKQMGGDGRTFSNKMKAEIAESGINDLWEDYVNGMWGIMEAEQEAGITRRVGKMRKTMHLPTNKWGEPILPEVDLIVESGQVPAEFSGFREYLQTMLRTFLTMHWGLAGPVAAKDPTVPWGDIIKQPRRYIRSKYLPDELVAKLKDPSKVPMADCLDLLNFWLDRQKVGKNVVFEFSRWQQSRYKSPVPREPRREAPEIPDKPGFTTRDSSDHSDEEVPERSTRSTTAKKQTKRVKGMRGKSGVEHTKSGGTTKERKGGKDTETREPESSSESDDEWSGVSSTSQSDTASSDEDTASSDEDTDGDSDPKAKPGVHLKSSADRNSSHPKPSSPMSNIGGTVSPESSDGEEIDGQHPKSKAPAEPVAKLRTYQTPRTSNIGQTQTTDVERLDTARLEEPRSGHSREANIDGTGNSCHDHNPGSTNPKAPGSNGHATPHTPGKTQHQPCLSPNDFSEGEEAARRESLTLSQLPSPVAEFRAWEELWGLFETGLENTAGSKRTTGDRESGQASDSDSLSELFGPSGAKKRKITKENPGQVAHKEPPPPPAAPPTPV